MVANIPPYIVWSTDSLDTSDPFQRRWLLKQVLTYGRMEDVRKLDQKEIRRELDGLGLPPEIYNLWKHYLEGKNAG